MSIRAVIIDDEPAGRDGIRALLARHPDVETVAECATGDEAIQAVEGLRPDLLFLDVQLPGATGVEVLQRIPEPVMPVVIFVTAYDDYALHAFDLHAADYLLKPYTEARFHIAIARARERLALDRLNRLRRGQVESEPVGGAPAACVERLTIRTASGVSLIPVDEIVWVEAAGDYVRVHVGDRWLLVRSTMEKVERRLDPARFVRIHRSTIVNLAFVRELKGSPTSDYLAVLGDGTTRAISGRGREQLSRALDIQL